MLQLLSASNQKKNSINTQLKEINEQKQWTGERRRRRRTLLVRYFQFQISIESKDPNNPYNALEAPTAGMFWIKREATKEPTKEDSI